ncbi:MAG: hypothetical protein L6R39_001105 [Caloplaca ligustica]|nr:MAG: hypothetical protein L6R39_001105 [Caloplaca ligustica]
MAPPFLYINGYPGVGKYTIAKELLHLLPKSKLLDNHLLIDPVAAVYERDMPEYLGLRKTLRQCILNSIASSDSLKDTTWVFTDSQSSDEVGSAAVADYIHAARQRGSPLISIVLTCEEVENACRITSEKRGKTKLGNVDILRGIRSTEDLYRFGGKAELELDVTTLSAVSAARSIAGFVTNTIAG